MDPPQSSSTFSKILRVLLGVVILGVTAYVVYAIIQWSRGLPVTGLGPSDQVSEPADGRSEKVIPASKIPLGVASDYGIQFWMYIKDWDTGFGKEKMILKRVDPANGSVMNPKISLHPTDNSLNVSLSVYPNEVTGTPTAGQVSASGDMFTCTVENVPLQSWFSVSVTVFQRNLDIYINGRLVKSCVLPGVPRPAVGDVTIGSSTQGFSGSVCTLKAYSQALSPDDAMKFFNAGTPCSSVVQTKVDTGKSFTLFGYTFKFSVFNKSGEEIRGYSF